MPDKPESKSRRHLSGEERFFLIVSLIIALQAAMMVYLGFLKSGFHVDEIWTYAHSNSFFRPYLYESLESDSKISLEEDSFFNKWVDSGEYSAYVTLTQGERFRYDSVFYNLAKSVHPPFYHVLIHTLYSFFPGGIDKWYGLSLNILFFILCQFVLVVLSLRLTGSKTVALLSILLWGFGTSAINNVMFIRMYVLLALFVLLFTYFSYQLFAAQTVAKKDMLGLFLATFLGSLTQHYFLIFAFLLTYLLATHLATRKQLRRALLLGGIALLGVAASVLVFPATITHLFSSYRGQEAIGNFGYTTLITGDNRLYLYFSTILRELLGIGLPDTDLAAKLFTYLFYGCCLTIGLLLIRYLYKNRRKRRSAAAPESTPASEAGKFPAFLAVSVLVYVFIIAKISPLMGMYTDRYVFCIFPLLAWFAALGIHAVVSMFVKNQRVAVFTSFAIGMAFIALCHITNDKYYRSIYLFTDTISGEQLSVLSGANCIIYPKPVHNIHAWAGELSQCKQVLTTYSEDVRAFSDAVQSLGPNQQVLLIIDLTYIPEHILDSFEQNTNFTENQFLFSGYFSNDDYAFYLLQAPGK
jgi:hypothetical protein